MKKPIYIILIILNIITSISISPLLLETNSPESYYGYWVSDEEIIGLFKNGISYYQDKNHVIRNWQKVFSYGYEKYQKYQIIFSKNIFQKSKIIFEEFNSSGNITLIVIKAPKNGLLTLEIEGKKKTFTKIKENSFNQDLLIGNWYTPPFFLSKDDDLENRTINHEIIISVLENNKFQYYYSDKFNWYFEPLPYSPNHGIISDSGEFEIISSSTIHFPSPLISYSIVLEQKPDYFVLGHPQCYFTTVEYSTCPSVIFVKVNENNNLLDIEYKIHHPYQSLP